MKSRFGGRAGGAPPPGGGFAEGKKLQDEVMGQLEELKIYAISFGVMSDAELRKLSVTPGGITHSDKPNTAAVYNGINDPRMGGTPKCHFCSRSSMDCDGHIGHIELPFKIYTPKLMPVIIDLCKIVCHKCYHIRIPVERLIQQGKVSASAASGYCEGEEEGGEEGTEGGTASGGESDNEEVLDELAQVAGGGFLREENLMDEEKESATISSSRLHNIALYIERVTKSPQNKYMMCSLCNNADPPVVAKDSNTHKRVVLNAVNGKVILPISDVQTMLERLPIREKRLLGFPDADGPARFIRQTLPVIPPRLRPPMEFAGVWENHHITTIYTNILQILYTIDVANYGAAIADLNKRKQYERDVMEFRETNADFAKAYSRLMAMLDGLMDNSKNEVSLSGPRDVNITTLSQMLTGKRQLIRGAIAGKRVDFTARLPIIHDEDLDFDEVGVPEFICADVPIRKRVTPLNQSEFQALWDNGKINYWAPAGSLPGTIKAINQKFRQHHKLQLGEFVWRPLRNGDRVLLGRQPTIHKTSIMGYRVRVMKGGRALVIPLPITMYHNADLDGDEMTLHVVQTEEAQEEVALMSPTNYIIDEETNKPGIAPTFNALTGARELTRRTTPVPEEIYQLIRQYLLDRKRRQVLPEGRLEQRLEAAGISSRSGFGVMSMLLPVPEGQPPVYFHMGKVNVENSVWRSGVAGKSSIGRSEGSLVQVLHMDYGEQVAADFVNDVTAVMSLYLDNIGFSISVGQCVPTGEARQEIRRKVQDNIDLVKLKIQEIEGRPAPLSAQEAKRREIEISDHLNMVAQVGQEIADGVTERDPNNSLLTMIYSGAKGEMTHVAAVTGLVGQSYFNGQRLQAQGGRTNVYYRAEAKCPEAKGFCRDNFGQGLSPADYVAHTTATREQIMDTGIKTADTGYLQRRIKTQMAPLAIHSDGMVRSGNRVYQYQYADGFRGSELMAVDIGGRKVLSPIDPEHIVEQLNARYAQYYT